MYELIVLSLLIRQPAHGYLIAKIINDIIGPIARASNGRIYPLLAKFEETGLIEAFDAEHDGRQMRSFRVTEAGRVRFHDLMMDTGSSPREYQEIFSFKVTVFEFITPAERRHLVDHYIHFCQAHIKHLEARLPGLDAAQNDYCAIPAQPRPIQNVLRHRIRQWQLEQEWAETLREEAE